MAAVKLDALPIGAQLVFVAMLRVRHNLCPSLVGVYSSLERASDALRKHPDFDHSAPHGESNGQVFFHVLDLGPVMESL